MLKETYIEFMMTKNLNHPNIAKHLYAVREKFGEKDRFHLVLEYVDGDNLSTYINK